MTKLNKIVADVENKLGINNNNNNNLEGILCYYSHNSKKVSNFILLESKFFKSSLKSRLMQITSVK